MTDRLLRVNEVCARLALGRTRVYELIQSEELPSLRVGTARRVPESSLERFIAERTTGRPAQTDAVSPTTIREQMAVA